MEEKFKKLCTGSGNLLITGASVGTIIETVRPVLGSDVNISVLETTEYLRDEYTKYKCGTVLLVPLQYYVFRDLISTLNSNEVTVWFYGSTIDTKAVQMCLEMCKYQIKFFDGKVCDIIAK